MVKKKVGSQIGSLIFYHINFWNNGQITSKINMWYGIGKGFSRVKTFPLKALIYEL
jgi:hypothetical protein